jgi:gamma-glutamylcyclotransferase (GGCT)/AIG2-like uncharacterized protein YtfP
MKVFVYGTLMKGCRNHRLLINEKFVGEGKLQNYGLYNVTSSYPGVVPRNGAAVLGEIYDVSEKTLERLDQLEGEGRLYIRKAVSVETVNGEMEAYIYLWNRTVNEKDYVDVRKLPWRLY